MMMKSLTLAWRNVLRNTRRSLMACGIVALGTVALLLTVGFVLATFLGLREVTIHSDVGHIQVAAPGGFERATEAGALLSAERVKALEHAVEGLPGVRFAMPRLMFEGLASTGDNTVAMIGRGVDPGREMRMSTMFAPIDAGLPLSGPKTPGKRPALLGRDLAHGLNVQPGEMVTILASMCGGGINAVDLDVCGTYRTGTPERDARNVMMPLGIAQELLGVDGASRFVVVLNDTDTTEAAAKALRVAFPDLEVQAWRILSPFYDQVVTLYTNIFVVMCTIIVFVVLLSVGNTMLMTVLERVREVGTMRAIGFPAARLSRGFALEGAIVGMVGGFAGLAVALIVSLAVTALGIEMPPPPGRTTPYPLIILVSGPAYGAVLLLMVLCGSVGAWVPAQHAVRKPIVEALGYD
ncbi:MAG TPA: ABC transporter permease [Geoalkalibacter subterraneus]|uniref:ABC transporter permease n=1 Tax=Geoalkalibacter subterraneus TaxID=483547 RepID=A0A831LHS2_9BACT|nr:ABC transporter permease [Geoalkalibacter subterraneus]